MCRVDTRRVVADDMARHLVIAEFSNEKLEGDSVR
jgi:hypothetical protein